MRVFGLDPGYGRMGFGCIDADGGRTTVVDYGVITTDGDDSFGSRLVQIAEDLESLLVSLKPDVVACERLYLTKNVKTAMQVAEARGVALYLCEKCRIPVREYTPSEIKLALTGDGKADKAGMTKMVTQLLHLVESPRIDDAADALGMALVASSQRMLS